MSNIKARRCSFENIHTLNADFSHSEFEDCNFTRSILENAKFTSSYIRECYFNEAQLNNTEYVASCLLGTYFYGAEFKNNDFSYSQFLSLTKFIEYELNKKSIYAKLQNFGCKFKDVNERNGNWIKEMGAKGEYYYFSLFSNEEYL